VSTNEGSEREVSAVKKALEEKDAALLGAFTIVLDNNNGIHYYLESK